MVRTKSKWRNVWDSDWGAVLLSFIWGIAETCLADFGAAETDRGLVAEFSDLPCANVATHDFIGKDDSVLGQRQCTDITSLITRQLFQLGIKRTM